MSRHDGELLSKQLWATPCCGGGADELLPHAAKTHAGTTPRNVVPKMNRGTTALARAPFFIVPMYAPIGPSVHGEDDLAERLSVLEHPVRVGRAPEGHHPVDHRLELALAHV